MYFLYLLHGVSFKQNSLYIIFTKFTKIYIKPTLDLFTADLSMSGLLFSTEAKAH